MPYKMELVNARPDDAIKQARDDTIKRAKDIWGLDYADASEGLYPSGNQIGRGDLRMDQCFNRATAAALIALGGRWQTAIATGLGFTPSATTGWQDWLDFVVDEDTFIIIEGAFSNETNPTITELKPDLGGVALPPIALDPMYAQEIPRAYLEVPAIVSPKSNMKVRLRSTNVGVVTLEQLGMIGETIAKRSYLILETY